MKIYTPEGWLDIPHIAEVADRNDINFIIIIGKRQVGKTYGVLSYLLDYDKKFVFMRRVKPELQMLTKGVNSPFEKIDRYAGKIIFKTESEYSAGIFKIIQEGDEQKEERIGMGTTLNSIAAMRGFNGDIYTDICFDEFIPEEHLYRVHNEKDAFNNAHTTINGNRELEGRPCVRTWLLANSNNLQSGVLDALNITKVIEKMSIRGEEERILKDRGIMILLPDSKQIIDKRKKGGLMRAIGDDSSKFVRMAYNNEFAYNDYTDVGLKPLKEYNPIVTVGDITILLHKNDKTLYIVERLKDKIKTLSDSETHLRQFNRQYSSVKIAYMDNRITFQSMAVKNIFLEYINI